MRSSFRGQGPGLVEILGKAGWDVVHVASLTLQAAADEVVLEAARQDARILPFTSYASTTAPWVNGADPFPPG
jgi:hypothetical protein